jgi:hypothetical protein
VHRIGLDVYNPTIDLCIMTSQGLMPAKNAGLSSHRPGNFDSGHCELFNFPWRRLLRPAFLAGIKPCDVIIWIIQESKCVTMLFFLCLSLQCFSFSLFFSLSMSFSCPELPRITEFKNEFCY